MEILPAPQGPRMLLSRSPISKCTSVFSEDLGRATEKRINEHNSGRALLEKSLEHWGLEISSLEVRRDENRAPYLSWIEGTWNNSPLPGISIGHSGNWAVCAIIEAGWWIGIDSEPTDRGIQENAFDMMASGEELNWLRQNPEQAIRIWTAKEAIQKAQHLGMNLNPRTINIDEYQVQTFEHEKDTVSVAWNVAGALPRTPEDDLLETTLQKMKDNPEFTIGCKTTRGGA